MPNDQQLADYLSGAMPPAERAAFEELLLDHPESLRVVLEQQRVEAGLHSLCGRDVFHLETAVMASVHGMSNEDVANQVMANTVCIAQSGSAGWKRAGWRFRWAFLAAAACLVLAATFGWQLWKPVSDSQTVAAVRPEVPIANPEVSIANPEVAVVQQTAGAQWPDGRETHSGARLRTGLLRLDAGLVRLQFLGGASVVIEGPAELDIQSPSLAVVKRGRVTANVPPVAEGFTLLTEGWRLVDRGTVFGVNVPDNGNAELHVLSGKVDVHGTSVSRSLTTGQAVRLGRNDALVAISASPESFSTDRDVFAGSATQQSEQLARWREASGRTAQDESLLLYYDFENADRNQGIIRNLAPAAVKDSNGVLIGGEWTEGRWPGKNAVGFRRVGDLIRTRPSQKLPTATFVAWVRFDAGFDQLQTLLLSPKVAPGQVYWLVMPEPQHSPVAALSFVIHQGPDLDRHTLAYKVLPPALVGRWMQLAVVADAGRGKVAHFIDGRLVHEQDLGAVLSMDLKELVIGNWAYSRQPKSFIGRMDELSIYRRCLGADEISRLYSEGKP